MRGFLQRRVMITMAIALGDGGGMAEFAAADRVYRTLLHTGRAPEADRDAVLTLIELIRPRIRP